MMKKKISSMTIALFIIYVLLSAGGMILFKLGARDLSVSAKLPSLSVTLNAWMLLGIAFYCVSFVLWLVIASRLPLSFAMPVSVGLVNICVLIGAVLVLHEKIMPVQWAGVGVIIAGLFLINAGGGK